jgi:hypothetical protein
MKFLLHDSDSLGYDFRDFEPVSSFVAAHPDDSIFIYTRANNIDLFARTLRNSGVCFVGYPRHGYSAASLAELQSALNVPSERVLAFADTYAQLGSSRTLPSGFLLPSGSPYLTCDPELIDAYLAQLRTIAAEYSPARVAFAVVSGLKPRSDVGESPSAQQEEGRRQSYPLEEIAAVAQQVQAALDPFGISFVPLSVQYGLRDEVKAGLSRVNGAFALRYPIRVLESVDWDSAPHQQAACYVALQRFAAEQRLPTVAYGNASTYLHLLLAAAGHFDTMAVALHGYDVEHPRDGRAYLTEVAEHLDCLTTFTQGTPGSWSDVSRAIEKHVTRAVLAHVDEHAKSDRPGPKP